MCGTEITTSHSFVHKLSPVAVTVGNYTFHETTDVLIQELENPFGLRFNVATVKQAECGVTQSSVSIYIRWLMIDFQP